MGERDLTKCCDKYSAGMLNEPVAFERLTRTPDGAGGYTESWAAVSGAPDRAHVAPLSGRERWASQRTEATVTMRIAVRYFSDLIEADKVTIRSKDYNIRYIRNVDFADRWLEIDLEGGVAV